MDLTWRWWKQEGKDGGHEWLRVYLVFHPSEELGCLTLVSQYHFRHPVLLLAASAEGHGALVGALL